MKELHDRQKFRNTLYSIPVLLLLAGVVFLLARGAGRIFAKERQSAAVLKELEEKNAELRNREEALKSDIARLQTDEGVVDEIRSKFNVTRPGEHLAIVVEENHQGTTTDQGTLAKLKRGWQWLLGLWGK